MVQDFALIDGEPPQANRRGEKWWKVTEACRENPGTWAVVPDCAPGVVHAIRARRYQAFREGQWEVLERPGDRENRMDVYVRFLGDEGQE